MPRAISTPLLTSTANGLTARIASATFTTVKPPDKTRAGARPLCVFDVLMSCQLNVFPLPPWPALGVSKRIALAVAYFSLNCSKSNVSVTANALIYGRLKLAQKVSGSSPWNCNRSIRAAPSAVSTSSFVGFTKRATVETKAGTRPVKSAKCAKSMALLDGG